MIINFEATITDAGNSQFKLDDILHISYDSEGDGGNGKLHIAKRRFDSEESEA